MTQMTVAFTGPISCLAAPSQPFSFIKRPTSTAVLKIPSSDPSYHFCKCHYWVFELLELQSLLLPQKMAWRRSVCSSSRTLNPAKHWSRYPHTQISWWKMWNSGWGQDQHCQSYRNAILCHPSGRCRWRWKMMAPHQCRRMVLWWGRPWKLQWSMLKDAVTGYISIQTVCLSCGRISKGHGLSFMCFGQFLRDCWYLVPQNALHYPWSCLPRQLGLFRPIDRIGWFLAGQICPWNYILGGASRFAARSVVFRV